jgi:hypothetical protein
MPDKWEYPWFAAWDTAFHAVVYSFIDPDFAKTQIDSLTREWLMHPNGQIPAYEWNFSDVNPPVHAWAALKIYNQETELTGKRDIGFLERVFQKLLLNFTWWVNRKDQESNNIFQGGFLGLDNIGVFDRSRSLPTGGYIDQADGTSWMGMYCLDMFSIAVELAKENRVYESMAVKFFEHFLYIADSINNIAKTGLWDEEDGFYYDILNTPNGSKIPLKVRSLVGLIPLLAVRVLETDDLDQLPELKNKIRWFIKHRPDLTQNVFSLHSEREDKRLLSIVDQGKLSRILGRMLNEDEFLGDFGIRSLSAFYRDEPYRLQVDHGGYEVTYQPGESTNRMFGGNSNWRGPIWFPLNFLIIEALEEFNRYFSDEVKVEYPHGSGVKLNLTKVSEAISRRLTELFRKNPEGSRPSDPDRFGVSKNYDTEILFHEYFDGDTGKGLGASHQTGWTALVANLILKKSRF